MINIQIDMQEANVVEVDNDGVKLTPDVDYTVSVAPASDATPDQDQAGQDQTGGEDTTGSEPSTGEQTGGEPQA